MKSHLQSNNDTGLCRIVMRFLFNSRKVARRPGILLILSSAMKKPWSLKPMRRVYLESKSRARQIANSRKAVADDIVLYI